MEDGGDLDEKIIAIPFEDPTYHLYTDISELPAHVASEIKHFFRVYKSLEGKETVVSDVLGRQAGGGGYHHQVPGCLHREILQSDMPRRHPPPMAALFCRRETFSEELRLYGR